MEDDFSASYWDLKEEETMYQTMKNYIETCSYDLNDMQQKIDSMWVRNRVTAEEHDELLELAREHASAEDSLAPLVERVEALELWMVSALERLDSIKSAPTDPDAEEKPADEKADEWPEFVAPTGAHDAYKKDDRITFASKRYICLMDGCVWTPAVYPAAWQEA